MPVKATFFLLITLCFVSCKSYKHFTYFRDIPDSIANYGYELRASEYIEPIISSNDILNVNIETVDTKSPISVNRNSGELENLVDYSPKDYLVDKQGFITLAQIGKVKVGGLSTSQASDTLTNLAAQYFKDPIVHISYSNFRITVLGEVNKPGQYVIRNEKVSILDALGLAGDMTIYGRRDNVLLLRNTGDNNKFIRLNLNSSNFLKSQYFYLKQGDVLYVQPNKAKGDSSDATKIRNFSIITSVLTLLIALSYRVGN